MQLKMSRFDPQGVANSAWALAKLLYKDQPFLDAVAAACLETGLPILAAFVEKHCWCVVGYIISYTISPKWFYICIAILLFVSYHLSLFVEVPCFKTRSVLSNLSQRAWPTWHGPGLRCRFRIIL